MYIEDIETNWNNGLGLFPVSNFVKLYGDDENADIVKLYEAVPDEPKDIIFYSEPNTNLSLFPFLTSTLMVNQYHVSLIIDESFSSILSIPRHRTILYCSADFVKYNLEKAVSILTENDIIIMNIKTIRELRIIRNNLLKHEVNSRIMFDASTFNKDEVLKESEVYDVIPYTGNTEIFKQNSLT